MTSDLGGLTLAIARWGGARAAKAGAICRSPVFLGKPARIDRFALDAGGLKAAGAITLRPDGGFEAACISGGHAGDGSRAMWR
ncbi:MAG: hypothetical protein R3D56_05075 [Paracoccaceae bacterium]